ncbi:hypothetical protein PLICRDRAFT_53586 [Plicaturopsis crispa FD-325 SS-3]|nr:hypothetical protein PLICRDRAFT_53586 [Plicaturopsis crispa FD-325 SS-3]
MPEVIACHGLRGKSGNAAAKATYTTNSTTLQNVVQNGRRTSSVVPTLSRGVKVSTFVTSGSQMTANLSRR